MKAAVAFALLAASPPQQFNLVCSGTVDVIRPGANTSMPYSRTLRVDLETKQWCAGECVEVEPIASIQPSRIVFRDVKRDTPREYWVEREMVDRVTGLHSSIADNGLRGPAPRSAFSSGQCEPAPFTGFARGPTKF